MSIALRCSCGELRRGVELERDRRVTCEACGAVLLQAPSREAMDEERARTLDACEHGRLDA